MPRRKKTHKLRSFIFYLIFGLIFTGVSDPVIIFYGPFNIVRKAIVVASITKLSHH